MSDNSYLINKIFKSTIFSRKCNFCNDRVKYYCVPYRYTVATPYYYEVSYFVVCKDCFDNVDWLDVWNQIGFDNKYFKNTCVKCHNKSKQFIGFSKSLCRKSVCMDCLLPEDEED